MPEPFLTRVRDRETSAIIIERVFGGQALQKLYGTLQGRLLTGLVLSRRAPNSIYGWLQRRPSSRSRITRFIESLGIDASEAERRPEEYQSLDEFFVRRLKPGARPIDNQPGHLVSPADGRVLVYPRLEQGALRVKESRVSLEELLGNSTASERYSGGTAIVVRLAPADYHRFHFPEHGSASESQDIAGRLHSVHPIALASGAPSLRNKRTVTYLQTQVFGTLALVEVGALCVGSIVQTYEPGRVERGQEKGYFRFGGSTVIVLAEAGCLQVDEDLIASSSEGMETLIRMGTRLGRCR